MSKRGHSAQIPAVGEAKRGERGYLGYLLRQAQVAHRQNMEHALAGTGLTLPQFSVLTMLAAYPGASGADLARLSLLTPQTVSVIVANLERSAAVARRAHAVHGRIQHLDVTPAGAQLLARCRARVNAVDAALRSGLSAQDEAVIRRWLVQVATRQITE